MEKRTVFITGGAVGIGAAAVTCFVNEGYQVAYMDLKEGEKTEGVLYIKGDVTRPEEMAAAYQNVFDTFGTIDTVVANAGKHYSDSIFDLDYQEMMGVINLNIMGTVVTIHESLPYLNPEGASIVVVASDQSLIGKKHSLSYGLTKGAMGQMTKSMALDMGSKNIRINAVCPATIDTPLTRNALLRYVEREGITEFSMESLLEDESNGIALGRIGKAAEVAELICFLGSDKASFITGGLFPVDGGLTAG